MTPTRPLAAVLLAAAVALPLAGCASASTPSTPASSTAASAPVSSAAAGTVDVCALVPADALKAAVKADPGTGKASKGKIDGGQCTWAISSTHTVLAQYTTEPDAYLPASIYKQPKTADAIAGVDRGWATAEGHSILVVSHGKGVLLNDIEFKKVSQKKFDALAKAIAANL